MILLDTCTLLWLASDQTRLSPRARGAITANAGNLFISSISAFEIAIKHARNKLALPIPPDKWFPLALSHHGITEIPVSAAIALASVSLDPHHHDPADRFIIATAQLYRLPILTPDAHIALYRGVQVIWS